MRTGSVLATLISVFAPLPVRADDLTTDAATLVVWLILLVGALILPIGLWLRRQLIQGASERARLKVEGERLTEILAAAPDGFYRWDFSKENRIGAGQCSRRLAVLLDLVGGTSAKFEDVLDSFRDDEASSLAMRAEALHLRGQGFEIELALKEGSRRVVVWGGRACDATGRPLADMVWMRDVTEGVAAVQSLAEESQALGSQLARFRAMVDALPLPVWLRDADLELLSCNLAYARAVDAATPEEAVERELVPAAQIREARALAALARAAGTGRGESFHLVMEGARKLMELVETPLPAQGPDGVLTVGIALDRTREEEALASVERHVAAHGEVLERLGTAIAIFSADGRLTFFNTAFCQLWGLESEWLATKPTYAALLDILRETRRLPEVADFRAFRDEETRRFTSLLEAREDLMHLPDERTLRRVVTPHPFGGLLFTFEDVTDALALERSHNTSLAVHRETLENLHEGIAVFASDGRLRLFNPAYARIWNLSAATLAERPHFADLVDLHQGFFASDWPAMRDWLQGLVTERQGRRGRIEREDGSILDYAGVPLPDGGVLTTWLDVSDTARVELALRDRNDALAAADRLKSEFIANVSAEVRAPLATVIGHADILASDMIGSLNERQKDYAVRIGEAARNLEQVFSDILELAAIEAGQFKLSLNAVDIHAMLSKVLVLIRERLRERQIALDFDCPLDIGWMVADERRIRQVLFTLLSNAVRLAPERGRIGLSARRQPTDHGEEIVLVLDEAELTRRLAADTEGQNDIGLALVRSFLQLHGGRIDSSPERGLSLHLPAGEA